MALRIKSLAAIFGGCLSVGLGAASCQQIVNFDETRLYPGAAGDAGSDGGASACGLPYGTSACASCVQANCCAQSTACAGDPACAPFFQCTGACRIDDWSCYARCWEDDPPGPVQTPGPLAACETASCASECGLSCGLTAGRAPPDAAASCAQCLAANGSCPAQHACFSSGDCSNAAVCFGRCFTSIDCGCTPSTEAGVALYDNAGVDFLQCGAACGVGVNWTCVGHVSWPAPTSNGSMLSAAVGDPITFQGLSGVTVEACYASDTSCSSAYAQGTTDATDAGGSATLAVPPSLIGHGLEANNYLQATMSGAIPTLYFWGFPISQPDEGFIFALGSQAEWEQVLALEQNNVTWESDRGTVVFHVNGCGPGDGIGVQVSLDAMDSATHQFYMQAGTPSFTATETAGPATAQSAAGSGGFVNVAAGIVTLTATPLAIGKPSSHATVLVRAGAVTFANLFPTP